MVQEAAVVADGDAAVAAVDQLPPEFDIAGGLGGFVVDGAVAKDADVRGVEEVRDAARLWDGPLRRVGQAVVAGGQGGEEITLDVGPGVGQGPQPGQVGIPVAAGDAREGAAGGEVEEVLRLDGSSQIIGRVVARDVTIRGKTIKAGSRVGLCIISANRDEEKFANPDVFDIRRGSRDHMAFGFGLHSCLGAARARMEIKVVFEEILKRIPHYEIEEAGLRLAHSPNVRGFTHVPKHFDVPDLRSAA